MSHAPTGDALTAFAHGLADLAAAAIGPHFRQPLVAHNKAGPGAFDPVTAADTAAEQAMRAALAAAYPDHAIVGEEFAAVAASAGSRLSWVLDPIDGTRAFIMGYPTWGTLIGLLEDRRAVLGVMDQPFTRERFWSGYGADTAWGRGPDGAEWQLRTRPCAALADAVLAATTPDMFAAGHESDRFATLTRAVRMRRFGGDCYAYCMLAAGHVDLVVEAGLKAVDIVALIPIIERAGGRVTGWDGGPAIDGGRVVAAGDARMHAAALRILS